MAAHAARHITNTFFNLDLHINFATLRQSANHMLRVDNFHIMWQLDIGCSNRAFAVFAQAQCYLIAVMQLEHNTLEVQQNANDIFLHTINRRVFMHNTCNRNFGWRIAHHGRQQHAAQGIAKRMTIATLEWLKRHLSAVSTNLLYLYVLGLQQIGLHSGFLSIPPARYTSKADRLMRPAVCRQSDTTYSGLHN